MDLTSYTKSSYNYMCFLCLINNIGGTNLDNGSVSLLNERHVSYYLNLIL